MNGTADRAKQLMDQVMKTWDPPSLTGSERPADIAQTSTMIAIAYIMGREFMPSEMTDNQRAAIDSGLKLFNEVLEKDTGNANAGNASVQEPQDCSRAQDPQY